MRAFWAIVGVLMLAAAGYLLIGRGDDAVAERPGMSLGSGVAAPSVARSAPVQPATTAPLRSQSADSTPAVAASPERSSGSHPGSSAAGEVTIHPPHSSTGAPAGPSQIVATEPAPKVEESAPVTSAQAQPDAPTQTQASPEAAPEPVAQAPQPTAPSPSTPVAAPQSEAAPLVEKPAEVMPSEEPALATGPASPETPVAKEPLPAAAEAVADPNALKDEQKEEWLVTRADGSMLADGRYVIRGKGTAQEPYKISWDHLISAEEEYVPREGRTEIPRRIQMLHDKQVEITGYVAFPLLLDSADELLVMLNQWDGCCLGVPPTPYDAVEVRLKNAVSGNAAMTSYGTLKGTFKVEPHLVGGWLVGLYLMEDAALSPLAYGGFAP